MAKAKGGSTCAPLRLRLGRQSFCHSPLLEPREDKYPFPLLLQTSIMVRILDSELPHLSL
jgi:hypothetical protein